LIGQRALIAIALLAGAAAGVIYYAGSHRTAVVVAARDLDATHALVADDLALVELPPDAVPAGAIGDASTAVGRVPRAPLWRGQTLLSGALGEDAAAFHTGLRLPGGMRAVALPVGAAQAVGGALVPGALVDVIAIPLAGRAPAGRATELLARAALVLDVRTDTGAAYGVVSARSSIASDRIGSAVVAIEESDEVRFADRIATSTFVLALVASR
jgi:Flp pilus assembly protein CpaB